MSIDPFRVLPDPDLDNILSQFFMKAVTKKGDIYYFVKRMSIVFIIEV